MLKAICSNTGQPWAPLRLLRLCRRLVDGIFLFGGLLFILYHFGVDLTAALAGVGVGGIAVALTAQKTLENIIAGVSLIADQAVRVGDFIDLEDVRALWCKSGFAQPGFAPLTVLL